MPASQSLHEKIGKMKRIQILLAVYNGEKYLREQLDSYLRLDNFEEVKILARDDGSTDGSLKILDEYSEKYGIEVIKGKNIGLNANFHELILARDRSCEYFAYSDQDDVWLESKLSRAVTELDKYHEDIPTLYAALSHITDESLEIIGSIFCPTKELSFYNAIVQNVCAGHTEVCNAALMNLLEKKFSEGIYVTDHWTYMLASAVGRVVFDKTHTTLYRQHGKNVIGYTSNPIKNTLRRIKRVLTTRDAASFSTQIAAFIECYGDIIPKEFRAEACKFLDSQRNIFRRLGYIFTTKAYRHTPIESLIFRFMYIFGKYKVNNFYIKETTRL